MHIIAVKCAIVRKLLLADNEIMKQIAPIMLPLIG